MSALPSVLKHAFTLRYIFHHLQKLFLKGSGKEGNVANAEHQVVVLTIIGLIYWQ